SAESVCPLQPLGIQNGGCERNVTAAISAGAGAVGRWSAAISEEEICWCACARTRNPLLASRGIRVAVWKSHRAILFALLQARDIYSCRTCRTGWNPHSR